MVLLEIHILNVIECKGVASIQNVVPMKPVSMENVIHRANVERMHCVKLSIIEHFVNVLPVIQEMLRLDVIHQQMLANQIHAVLELCVNWIVVMQFASVRKD